MASDESLGDYRSSLAGLLIHLVLVFVPVLVLVIVLLFVLVLVISEAVIVIVIETAARREPSHFSVRLRRYGSLKRTS